MSCAREKHYGTLTFFFDGVPDTTTVIKKDTLIAKLDTFNLSNQSLNIKSDSLVTHPPYGKSECIKCHDKQNNFKLVKYIPDLCYTCHEDFNKKFNLIHGPVAGPYCTKCHNPHNSRFKKLVLVDGNKLCLTCHVESEVVLTKEHADYKTKKCWDCHNPHGGNMKYFLKG